MLQSFVFVIVLLDLHRSNSNQIASAGLWSSNYTRDNIKKRSTWYNKTVMLLFASKTMKTDLSSLHKPTTKLVLFEPRHFLECENKGTDQFRSNCEADQRLRFRYSNSAISLLLKIFFRNFRLLAIYCNCTGRFASDLLGNLEEWFSRVAARLLSRIMRNAIQLTSACLILKLQPSREPSSVTTQASFL